MVKAVAYCRYSSDMQNQDSIEAQLREIRMFAQKNGMEIVHEYIDEALSGKTDEREQFQQMITDAKKSMFDALIVHKIDRFARNRYDSAIYKAQLKRHGIKIYYAAQNLSDDPEGRLMEGILESFAQYYSENLAAEVMKGMKTKALRAEWTGGIPALGFDCVDKKLIINQYEAGIVKLIFDMHSSGRTYGEILGELKDKGYKTKAGREFGKNSLNSILQNEKYIGTYIYNKTESAVYGKRNMCKKKPVEEMIILPNALPAIIDNDVWTRSQKRIGMRKSRAQFKSAATYLLSGIVYCGECGNKLFGDKSKRIYYYYRCYNKECTCLVRKEQIEEFVLQEWNKQFFTKQAIIKLTKALNEHQKKSFENTDTETKHIEKSLNKCQSEINNIVNVISKGVTVDSLIERLKLLEQVKKDLSYQLLSIKTRSELSLFTPEEIEENLNIHKAYVQNMDLSKCKQIIEKYISKVIISRASYDIKFNLDYLLKKMNKSTDTIGVTSSAPKKKERFFDLSFLISKSYMCLQSLIFSITKISGYYLYDFNLSSKG
jgi:site-specific DNA recombinase